MDSQPGSGESLASFFLEYLVHEAMILGTVAGNAIQNQAAELEREGPPKKAASAPLTLRAFSVRWLTEYAATRRTDRGRSQAEQRFRDYLWPTHGDAPLAQLKPLKGRRRA